MSLTSRGGGAKQTRCFACVSVPAADQQDRIFEAYELSRASRGYARYGDKIDAHCVDCGAERRVSITELARGVAPCLHCAGPLDPDAPHYVYLMDFPTLRAYKIGITNSAARHDRIASHEANGGVIMQVRVTPNRQAAKTVEDHVLRLVVNFPSGCTSRDFPQGGYTETWGHDAESIDLDSMIAYLHEYGAPGFNRLNKLEEYFAQAPATISELDEFVRLEVEEFDGVQVQCVSMSKPLEQMLGQIRARRVAMDASD